MRLPVDFIRECQPKMSWANFAWDLEDEEDEPDITLPSWGKTKANDPVPSAPVQKTVKRLKNVSSHKEFSQKSVSDMWQTPAPSSSYSSATSGPSPQDQMLEFPSLDVYRTSSPVASEPQMKKRKNKIPFAQKQELVEQEASIEASPVTADPAPSSQGPQNGNMDMSQDPASADVSSSANKNRKGRNKMCFPQMETRSTNLCMLEKGQHLSTKPRAPRKPAPVPERQGPATRPSGINRGNLWSRPRNTPEKSFARIQEIGGQKISIEPRVTPTRAPVPEHQAPATSSSTVNGVNPRDRPKNTPAETSSHKEEVTQKTVTNVWQTPALSSSESSAQDGMMLEFPSLDVYRTSSPVAPEPKKNRVSFAEQQELVEQEASIETPVPADPAPPSEEPTIKDPQNVENNMDQPEDPDMSSTAPAVSKRKKKSRRGRSAIYLLLDQKMRTELQSDSNNENLCMLKDRQQLPPEPPVTPTPDPEPEHSASDVSIISPGASEGKMKKKKRVSFAENVELIEQEASIETPVPADPTPQSEEPTIKDPQNVEHNMDNPEDPDVSSTPPVVSKKKKKKSRRGRNKFCSPEEQEMRTEL
ncbi:cell surface glycoprotein 1-like isoform X2 [Triplophysa rosa]|uniref:cell surface glycoprotein 1-like isoform X2 n=1 Tax=Triplophysa rosa TaxID=992332 RepID=UPI002545E1B6|nr:cell surface glycoprotein 1-like isoform X2 [Triplophysa rosa]